MTVPRRTPASRTAYRTVVFVSFLAVLELTSGMLQGGFPVLLPALGHELHLSAGDMSTAYSVELLSAGVSVPLLARLGDIYGHRRLIQATVALTLAGYALTALADSFPVLIAGRILSGLLGCWLPLEFAIVRDRAGAERSGPAVGLLVGALSLGVSAGSFVVGVLDGVTSSARTSLWVLTALLALCLLVSLFLIPESTTRARCRVDWTGGILVSLGLALVFNAIAELLSAPGRSSAQLLPGVLLLAAFVWHELRTPEPLIDIRMLAGKALAPAFGLSLMLGLSLYGVMTLAPEFAATDPSYGYGWGFDTLRVSLISMCTAVGTLVGGVAADRMVRWLGERAVLTGGFGLSAVGYASIALLHADPWQFGLGLLANGLGVGLTMSAIPLLLMHRTPPDQTAVSTGIYNTLKSLAGGISGAAFGAVLNRMLADSPAARAAGIARESGYATIWAGCAVLCLLAVLLGLKLRPGRADGSDGTEDGDADGSTTPLLGREA